MFKFFAFFISSFFCFSAFAYEPIGVTTGMPEYQLTLSEAFESEFRGQAPSDPRDLQPLEELGDAQCQVVFEIEQIVFFDRKSLAQDFCKGIRSNYRFENSCFVRGHGDLFEANFRHRGGFGGSRFGDVFDRFGQFVNSRRLYHDNFIGRHRFFNCRD